MQLPSVKGEAPSGAYAEAALLARLMKRDAVTYKAAMFVGFCTIAIFVIYLAVVQMSESSAFARRLAAFLSFSREASLTGFYMHGLLFLCAASYLLSYWKIGSRLLLFLGILYAYLWFDDSSRYHEEVGRHLAEAFDMQPAFGLRGQDFGELAAWLLAAILLIPLFVWAWAKHKPGDLGIAVLALPSFAALVFFGGVVDMVQIMAPDNLSFEFRIAEDAGEVMVVALTAILAVGLSQTCVEYRQFCSSVGGSAAAE